MSTFARAIRNETLDILEGVTSETELTPLEYFSLVAFLKDDDCLTYNGIDSMEWISDRNSCLAYVEHWHGERALVFADKEYAEWHYDGDTGTVVKITEADM